MDILCWGIAVLVIVLLLAMYYFFLNTRHLTAGNHPVRKTSGLHVKDVRLKENLKTKRKYVSSQRLVLFSNNGEKGRDGIRSIKDERYNDSTDPFDNLTESWEMIVPDMEISVDDYKIFQSFVDEEKLIKCIQLNGTFKGLCEYVSRNQVKWKEKQVKIAIAGNSGTGKSSLINALRGMRPDDEGAAKVGVTETTTERVEYPFPQTDRLLLVDLPGMGTIRFPRKNYMEDMEVPTYDAFVIVTSGRITENDVWFVKEAMKMNKHVLFVRTKIDTDLSNAKYDKPKGFNEEYTLVEIKEEISETLIKGLPPGKMCEMYLVSSHERNRYEFSELEKTLKNILNVFAHAIRKLLQQYVQLHIDGKREFNKGEFFGRKIAAFLTGLLSIKTYNLSRSLGKIRQICLRKFCLDPKSIEEVSIEIAIPEDDLKKRLKSFKEDIKEKTFTSTLLSVFESVRNYNKVQNNLSCLCDDMAADEMKLINLKLNIIEKELSIS